VRTLDKLRDAAVDEASTATVDIGHRILSRILGHHESRSAVENAVRDVAAGEAGSDVALQLQVRKALVAAPELAVEIAKILPPRSMQIEAAGTRSIAIGDNTGIASTGDNTTIYR
jgi:hypothetical protein